MKVLVTGGAGYIGSHAVFQLIKKGYEVVVVDNLCKGFESNLHPDAKFYNVDIRDTEGIKNIFLNEKNIEAIMHFAGLIVVPESVEKPLEYFDVNVNGVLNLLSIAKEHDLKTFIFSSTAAVYGNPKNIPIKEDDIKEPINPYGESKLSAEYLIKSWAKAYDRNYVIFRYFNVAGADESGKIGIKSGKPTHLLPLVISSAIDSNKVFKIFGNDYNTNDGTCIRDFVHVNDLVNAHVLGMEWSIKNNKSNIFNLGSGKGFSVKEILDESIKTLNIDIKWEIHSRRKGDPAILCSDVSNAKKNLGWKTNYSLEEMILSEYKFRKSLKNKSK